MGSLTKTVDRPTQESKMRSILSLMVVSLFLAVKSQTDTKSKFGKFFYFATEQDSRARVNLISAGPNTGKDPVYGELYLKQTPTGVFINGQIYGLEPGKHGFHVHAVGDLGNACKNAGGHFNPQMKQHGKPNMIENRHVGDLGNIITPLNRLTLVSLFDPVVTLDKEAENGITGKAFVVHAGEDDLGMGGDDGSLKTGNAGARLACGIIEPLNY